MKEAFLPSDIPEPTAAAVANQDTDEPNETNVAHPLETGPIVLQLSYSVGCRTLRLSALGANDRLVIWRFTLEDSE